jgi:spore maturation protein CgeB
MGESGLDNFFKIYPNAYQGTNLSNENAAKLYRSAKILLNLNHPQTKFNGINQRAFEIPACNGFQLIDSRDGFSEVFANNKDLVYFNSTDEIPGLVSYFLENETERLNIAKSGNLKVWEKHSIENRVIEILKILKD